MGRLFSYDSPIIQTINKIVDCVLLSILWLLFSIPVITFGASTSALYYTVNKVIRHNRSHIWREFWRSFKGNFKQSTIVWLVLLVLFYILGVDYIFLTNAIKSGTAASWILGPFIVMAVLMVMIAIYVFAYIARFQNNLKSIIKNSAFFAIRHLLRSIVLVVILAAEVVVCLFVPITIIIVPTLGMYLITLVMESIFQKYMSIEDLEAETERNRVYYN